MTNGKVTNTFINETAETVEFRKVIPASMLRGSIFRHYGYHDPAGLCDGGDYLYNVQIRVENEKGDIYISIEPIERGEWWFGKLSWKEFFDLMLKMVKDSKKFKHCEH